MTIRRTQIEDTLSVYKEIGLINDDMQCTSYDDLRTLRNQIIKNNVNSPDKEGMCHYYFSFPFHIS